MEYARRKYKSGIRSSAVRSSVVASGGGGGGGGGSGRLCEVRRAYKAAVVPCKTGRRRARGMSMGQKVSGVKAVNRDAAAPYKPVIPRELAQPGSNFNHDDDESAFILDGGFTFGISVWRGGGRWVLIFEAFGMHLAFLVMILFFDYAKRKVIGCDINFLFCAFS
ncbi:uncharacterized protein LOC135143764 [Zophobas morio]|uniref:uncharacterized protein LOC135143764 n=1 Tax=Zophobas morio TaxID=2755281 RepID=UPI003082F776